MDNNIKQLNQGSESMRKSHQGVPRTSNIHLFVRSKREIYARTIEQICSTYDNILNLFCFERMNERIDEWPFVQCSERHHGNNVNFNDVKWFNFLYGNFRLHSFGMFLSLKWKICSAFLYNKLNTKVVNSLE